MEGFHTKHLEHDPLHSSPEIELFEEGIEHTACDAVIGVIGIGVVQLVHIDIQADSDALKRTNPVGNDIDMCPFVELIGEENPRR